MSYHGFPRYVSVGEKKARAEKKLKQLKKKNPGIKPVVIEGQTIAKTWWGKAWNNNLEKYADYANRIGRGRSYVRHRAVLDLQIKPGMVNALVQGSRSTPYSVTLRIDALDKKSWKQIKTACADTLHSLQDLLAGRFPKVLSEIFTARGKGLFPSPDEIHLNCSCPDWANMCKHVAATLYGIGARLDKDPSLFFKLRKVKMDDLVAEAMMESSGKLLKKAEKKKDRGVIADSDLGDVFGIEMEDHIDFGEKKPLKDDKTFVLDIISKSKKGIGIPAIKVKTKIPDAKIRYIISRAHGKGIIKRISRGVYAGKKIRQSVNKR